MLKKLSMVAALLSAAAIVSIGIADDEKPTKKDAVKGAVADEAKKDDEKPKFRAICPITGKAAKEEVSFTYKEGKGYACCENCLKKLTENPDEHATKLNAQLVVTRQYVQAKCPLSGGDVDKEKFARVGGARVTFCCEKCQGKVKETEDKDEQLAMVFGAKPFETAFVKKVAKKKKDGEAKKDAAAKEEKEEKEDDK